MKFSTRATYGLKALLYLADHYGENAVAISKIADEEGISAAYLEQILNRLKTKSLVRSIRGPHGGYVLTRKPSEISISEVFTLLGETVRRSNGGSGDKNRQRPAAHRASEIFWERLFKGFEAALDRISLQDLLTNIRNPSAADAPLTFSI